MDLPNDIVREILAKLPDVRVMRLSRQLTELVEQTSDYGRWVRCRKPGDLYRYGTIFMLEGRANGQMLAASAEAGNTEVVKYLVERNPGIAAEDCSALRSACKNGHLEIAKYLVENGAKISAENYRVLRAATRHTDVVKYLVSQDAVAIQHSDAALCYASLQGNIEVVKFLVVNGAVITARTLPWATTAEQFGIIKFLIENGADTSADNGGALYRASKYGLLDMVKFLVEHGYDVTAGEAMKVAIAHGHTRVAEFLAARQH